MLQLNHANAVQNSTVAVNAAGSLAFGGGIGTFNVGGLTGSSDVALTDLGGGAVTLSVGGNNQSTTYDGSLTGLGNLTKVGNGALTLTNTHSYQGATTIAGGTLQLAGNPIPGVSVPVGNASFETPVAGDFWKYLDDPTINSQPGVAWTFSGYAGVSIGGGAFAVPTPVPDGNQVALIQDAGNPGSMSQVINFATAGTYTVAFQGACRPGYGPDEFQVEVDGVVVGDFTPPSGDTFQSFDTDAFTVTSGTHTLAFVGVATGQDVTSFIDVVTITGTGYRTSNTLPVTTPVSITTGATLDLNGISQQIASLSDVNPGDTGTVQNSNAAMPTTLTLSATAARPFSAAILPAAAAWARSTSSWAATARRSSPATTRTPA